MKLKSLKIKGKLYFYMLFSIIFFSNCYLIPCNLDSGLNELNIKQEDDFFIGEYVVENVINNSYNFKINNTIIKLNRDGTIEMKNMPIKVFDLKRIDKEINVKGTWRQNFIEDRREDRYYMPTNLEFDNNFDIRVVLRTIKIYTKNNKPVLFIEFGDPDECTAIRFIKK